MRRLCSIADALPMGSKSSAYGLRAAIYLATLAQNDPFVSIDTISEELDS